MSTHDASFFEPPVDIRSAYRDLLRQTSRPPTTSQRVRCSELGHPCTRYLYYATHEGEKAERPSDLLLGIFATGTMLEPILVRRIDEAGHLADPPFRLSRQQSPVTGRGGLEHWPVSGTCDAVIEMERGGVWFGEAVCDIKTVDRGFYGRSTVDELCNNMISHKWVIQLEAYAAGMGLDKCCLIMCLKQNLGWEIRPVWWLRDDHRLGQALSRASRAFHAVDPPTGINRRGVCERCKFLAICNPALESEDNVYDDPDLEDLLDRRAELEESGKELRQIDKQLKDMVPSRPSVIVGNWHLKRRFVERKAYSVGATSYWQTYRYERL